MYDYVTKSGPPEKGLGLPQERLDLCCSRHMVGKFRVIKRLPCLVDQLPVDFNPWTMLAHSLMDWGNLVQVFFPGTTVCDKALLTLEKREDLTQFFHLFFPFFSSSTSSFLSKPRLQITRHRFEGVEILQLFIEPSLGVQVDERVEGGVEVKVNIQDEVINLRQR